MELENIWIIAAAALAVGALIGYLIGRSGDAEQQKRKLEEELTATRQEMDKYKKDVTSHFEQTASLVNELTDNYRKVHQHLASSAQTLCPGQPAGNALKASLQPQQLVENLEQPGAAKAETAQKATDKTVATEQHEAVDEKETHVEPPRDYAPKKPEDEGTLSDRYGLKKSADKVESPIPDLASADANENEESDKRTVH
ncbi:YhcB family protein [Nitrincola sp. MINF-07-Sa-05]|uniref:YhcB family protein n=1 Tax=Nitrincola salilacus TaxID=3400273 RepID=UPI003917CA7B